MKKKYLVHLLIMLVFLSVESAQKHHPYVGDPIKEGINKGRRPIIYIDPLSTIHSEESSEVESSPSPISRKAIVERAFRPGSISPIPEESFLKNNVQLPAEQETFGQKAWSSCRTFMAFTGCIAWIGMIALYIDYEIKVKNGHCFSSDQQIW